MDTYSLRSEPIMLKYQSHASISNYITVTIALNGSSVQVDVSCKAIASFLSFARRNIPLFEKRSFRETSIEHRDQRSEICNSGGKKSTTWSQFSQCMHVISFDNWKYGRSVNGERPVKKNLCILYHSDL